MNIRKHVYANNIIEICASGIGQTENALLCCNEIVKHFFVGNEFFFSMYREDGFNLTLEELIKFRIQIPDYFQEHGQIESVYKIDNDSQIKHFDSRIHLIGRLPATEDTYEMLPVISKYYLETLLFSPMINWDMYKELYIKNSGESAEYYIRSNYADMMFAFVDSGDFKIVFNSSVHDESIVYRDMVRIVN